jgi:hypothetical protein
MSAQYHRFCELFAQLGLPSDVQDVSAFIEKNSPLPAHVRLEEAAFWTPAQAALLRDELLKDADWAELVDQLNLALRAEKN